MTQLACLSVDLDEIHHYFGIHGLAVADAQAAPGRVYEVALPRFSAFAEAHGLPLTFFAVGADARRSDRAQLLKRLVADGHEVGNHSLDHRYDLTRLPQVAMQHQVIESARILEHATGRRPVGFRAPGYVMSDALAEVLEAAGVAYDSSVFPCPVYYAAKALALAGQRIRRRVSVSVIDSPRVLAAPTVPYRQGRPYYRAGRGLLELPIQVTPRLRLPVIGTALTLSGKRLASWLTTAVTGLPFVNLELHGIDLLDVADGLEGLARYQPDLRVPRARKREILDSLVARLRGAGYRFARLDEAAAELQTAL